MLNKLTDPVPSRRLGISRVIIGTAALIRAFVALPVLLRLAEPDILKAPNFDWFPEPSVALAYVVFGLWLVSAILVIIGWRLPISGLVLFACLAFMVTFDRQTYSNHLYLMTLLTLLLVVADASAGFVRGREDRPVPRWPILLMCFQVSLVYAFSAITKLQEQFLSGRVLAGVLRDGIIPFPENLRTPLFLGILATGAVATELFIALGLWVPRWRKLAYLAGIALHLPMILLLEPTFELLVFAMLMYSVYPLYDLVRPGNERIPAGDVASAAT